MGSDPPFPSPPPFFLRGLGWEEDHRPLPSDEREKSTQGTIQFSPPFFFFADRWLVSSVRKWRGREGKLFSFTSLSLLFSPPFLFLVLTGGRQ